MTDQEQMIQLHKDLDAFHTRALKLSLTVSSAFRDDVKDLADHIADVLADCDLPAAVERYEENERQFAFKPEKRCPDEVYDDHRADLLMSRPALEG